MIASRNVELAAVTIAASCLAAPVAACSEGVAEQTGFDFSAMVQ